MCVAIQRVMAESLGDTLSEELEPLKVSTTPLAEGKVRVDLPEENICCICQEISVNPVQLPCSHVFCFLCIKGVAARSNHCALCRHKINPDVLDNPDVVNRGEIQTSIKESSESHKWYYEAKNGGWWLYEQRTSSEIEKAFKESKETVRLQISGFYYIIDFESMVQFREGFPTRRRHIKRDKVKAEAVKGVAGIIVKSEEYHEQGRNWEGTNKREINRRGSDRTEADSRWLGRSEVAISEQDRSGTNNREVGLGRNVSSEQDQHGRGSRETGTRGITRHQGRSVHSGTQSDRIWSVDSESPVNAVESGEHCNIHTDTNHDSEEHQTRLVTGHD